MANKSDLPFESAMSKKARMRVLAVTRLWSRLLNAHSNSARINSRHLNCGAGGTGIPRAHFNWCGSMFVIIAVKSQAFNWKLTSHHCFSAPDLHSQHPLINSTCPWKWTTRSHSDRYKLSLYIDSKNSSNSCPSIDSLCWFKVPFSATGNNSILSVYSSLIAIRKDIR